jgi:hypothetical protein
MTAIVNLHAYRTLPLDHSLGFDKKTFGIVHRLEVRFFLSLLGNPLKQRDNNEFFAFTTKIH